MPGLKNGFQHGKTRGWNWTQNTKNKRNRLWRKIKTKDLHLCYLYCGMRLNWWSRESGCFFVLFFFLVYFPLWLSASDLVTPFEMCRNHVCFWKILFLPHNTISQAICFFKKQYDPLQKLKVFFLRVNRENPKMQCILPTHIFWSSAPIGVVTFQSSFFFKDL